MDPDIYGKTVPELNGLYRSFYDLQKSLFRPSIRKKKFDYEKLSAEAERTYKRASVINAELSKENVNPLLIKFSGDLVKATQWMYLYLVNKALNDDFASPNDTELAFNHLFKASRTLTKSAKRIS